MVTDLWPKCHEFESSTPEDPSLRADVRQICRGSMPFLWRVVESNPGSSDKSRGKPSLPDLSLHIVDMKGEERESVSLGELLRVQVRMSDEGES
ncbi:hypothetical protein TNCV_4993131 [Trichonephila clavipes]|nr:hypothetical protein TNCV_4993131 [Trichonephila clavipes]